jgi:hypothetical protein
MYDVMLPKSFYRGFSWENTYPKKNMDRSLLGYLTWHVKENYPRQERQPSKDRSM